MPQLIDISHPEQLRELLETLKDCRVRKFSLEGMSIEFEAPVEATADPVEAKSTEDRGPGPTRATNAYEHPNLFPNGRPSFSDKAG